ncbi:MAG: hypothetical protein AB8G99_11880 [Planctomycetaceae bacterium]
MSSASDEFAGPLVPQNQIQTHDKDSESTEVSFVERVLSSFLQEQNIRWMLGLGVLILLGSSLTFVTSHWNEMQDIWKYFVLFGYTGAIHVCGQTAYHKLNLRKTGTALMVVTLLLIPLVFFSLHWVSAGTAVQAAGLVFFIFSAMAGRRIVRHFFRSDQPAVLAAFLTLSVFGAAAPMLPGSLAPLWVLFAWAAFAFGSVKANREVFWMAEEHKLPRIFGFFPIALFGLQFVAIFGLHFRDAFPTFDWFGLCCVLTAAPIMLTADAFANVFRQRTGDLVRPLPWSIIGPIVLGMSLCAAGLVIAGTGIASGYPFALVPTAAMFAVMMFVTARRTGNRGFVWAMLLGIVLTYQFSPVFFKEVAIKLRNAAATAINEKKLPIEYYGLTYLPLLFAGSLIARARLKISIVDFFGIPIKHFTLGMSVSLLAISYMNPGANFLVGLAMAGFLLWQAVVFRDRSVVCFSIIACVTAAVQCVPFVEQITQRELPADSGIFVLSILAMLMQTMGRAIDRRFENNVTAESEFPKWCTSWQAAALPVTLGAVAWWLLTALPSYRHEPAHWSGLLLVGLLTCQAIVSTKRGFGELALVFSLTLFIIHSHMANWLHDSGLVLAVTVLLLAMYLFAQLTKDRRDRVAVAFSKPASRVAHLLVLVACGTGITAVMSGMGELNTNFKSMLAGLLATYWCFREGRRKPTLVLIGFVSLLAWECGVVGTYSNIEWLPAAWALTSVVSLRAARNRKDAVLEPLSLGLMSVLATGSLLFFGLPNAIAGGIVMAGFLMHAGLSGNRNLRGFCLIVANWQVLGIVLRLVCPSVSSVFDLTLYHVVHASLPIAALAAISSLILHHPRIQNAESTPSAMELHALLDLQFWALSAMSAGCLLASVLQLSRGLSNLHAVYAVIAFASLSASTFMSACAKKSELRVWASMLLVVSAVLYLVLFDVITLGSGLSMFAILVAAVACEVLSRIVARREGVAFAARPYRQAARLLPMGTVLVAIVRRYSTEVDLNWLGMNSLAVLVAAAYYFWCGIEEKSKRLIVLAAAIVNMLFLLLCVDLDFRDPQFFMIPIGVSVIGLVQILKREIPVAMRNPLRYAGALMILVSPTFHIVDGSWLHMFSLLVCAIVVSLVAIGLRIRPLLYAGTAFLIADIVAMVVFGVSDHPDKLWLFGLAAGIAVIALGAFFESQRANLMSRVRLLATELDAWE